MASTNRDTPTYMDRFALHLAKELVGTKTVLQVLNEQLSNHCNNCGRNKSLLYWRSELFLNDPSDIMDATQWPCASDGDGGQHLMYLDAKFEFCNKPTTKQVETTFGCFVLRSNDDDHKYKNYGMYYKSKPVTLECLKQHMDSMGCDLADKPQDMAETMRPAMTTTKGKNKEYPIRLKKLDDKTIQVQFDYEFLGTGVLTLDLQDEASSPYNEMALEPFYLRDLLHPEKDVSQYNFKTSSTQVVTSPSFGSPTVTPPSPAAAESMENSKLDQLLHEWFRLVPVEDKKKEPEKTLSPPPAVANKKRPANLQNHQFKKVTKKPRRKGDMFKNTT